MSPSFTDALFTCSGCDAVSTKPFDPQSVQLCLFRLTGDNEVFARLLESANSEILAHAKAQAYALELETPAEVFVNQAALHLLRGAPNFDCHLRFMPYYKAIVTNYARDVAEYERRRTTTSLGGEDGIEPAAPLASNPVAQAQSNEEVARILRAVANLRGLERLMMNAKIEGNSRREIAAMFHETPARVSRILHQAKARLRDALDN